MKRSVKTLSLTIPRDLYERIAALAERDGRSLSNYVGWVLGQHIAALDAPVGWKEVIGPNG
jgi:predicted DNA-binding protein